MSPTYSSPEPGLNPLAPLGELFHWLASTTLHVALGVILGWGVARLMRSHQLNWTWAGVAFVVWLIARPLFGGIALTVGVAALSAAGRGRRWRREDIEAGGDLAQIVRSFQGPLDAVRAVRARAALRRLFSLGASWFQGDELLIGQEQDGHLVRIPLGGAAGGTHTLVVGAAGSGKTVTQTGIAVHAIEHGMGAILVDPKGDPRMLAEARSAAERMGRPFVHWTPEGSVVYNPYAHGSETEIADKLLSGEHYSEPHYLRQAQRYLGHEVRVLRQAGVLVSLANVVRYLDPQELEVLVRALPEQRVEQAQAYLTRLSPRQQDGLSGVRDRLAVMAESDVGRWLDPETPGAASFDLLQMVEQRAVVFFSLESDRRPLLAHMLGAAIVQDLQSTQAALQSTQAALQSQPIGTLVVIDEFAALAAEQVVHLFGRARGAGMSLVLGTQELSDMRVPGRELLLEQVMGNLTALIAHRQVVPASATLIAEVAGTQGAWATTVSSDGRGTRSRGREYMVHPDEIKTLPRGHAAVIVPTGKRPVRIARIFSLDR
jgi:type IV secretory pathway TraG/TraD family ATPase VirD4